MRSRGVAGRRSASLGGVNKTLPGVITEYRAHSRLSPLKAPGELGNALWECSPGRAGARAPSEAEAPK